MKQLIKSMFTLTILLLLGFTAFSQNMQVKGVVTDEDGAPVIGASVIQKDVSGNGVITGVDGTFQLSVPRGAALIVSCLGYQDTEVTAAPQLAIVLSEDRELLDEVVVVGYGVQRKSNLTGAISSVSSEDIQNRSITHLEQALQGKTPGVQLISTSSQPGAVPTVRVRGIASNGTSNPLYVVDGLLVDDISTIDPSSIESMEVLKDAASAAIYGAQAGNGVILISTRRGQRGDALVTYDFQYSLNSMAVKPELLNVKDFIDQHKLTNDTSGFDDNAVLQLIDEGVWDGKFSTDWYKVALATSPTVKHTLNIRGANEKASYFMSLGNVSDNGILKGKNDTYNRFTVSLNADYQVKQWLKVGITSDYAHYVSHPITDGVSLSGSGGNPNTFQSIMNQAPYVASTYAPDSLPLEMRLALEGGSKLFTDENGNYYETLAYVHPYLTTTMMTRKNYGDRISGTLFANLTPVKGLVFTTRLGYKVYTDNTYSYRVPGYYGGSTPEVTDLNSTKRENYSTLYYQWENFVNYSRTIGGNHNLGVMAGMSFSQNDVTYLMGHNDKGAKDDPLYADLRFPAGNALKNNDGIELVNRKLSYFGRLNYNYAERYLLEAVFRADSADSSILPAANRWGYFPSFSAGWIVSGESFFQPLKEVVSFMKIRASWGLNGSTSNLSGYLYSNSIITNPAGYSFTPSIPLSYQTIAYPGQLYNPNLKWETSDQIDFGLDVRMFRDRLALTADWFRKDTRDLIISHINVPYEAGNQASPINGGNIRNTGVELELSWKDKIGDVFYSVSGNLATLNNKVTYLSENVDGSRIWSSTSIPNIGAMNVFEKGYPIWYFRGYQVDHLDQNGAPVLKDNDGVEGINDNDKTMIGKPLPDFTYGLTLNIAYKGIDFTVFANGSQGNDVWMCYTNRNINYPLKSMYDQRWTEQNKGAKYAAPSHMTEDGLKYLGSDAFIFDGSFFRIRQIQLGYSFPEKLINRIGLSQLRAYTSLDNFFLFTSYPGLDPEVSNNVVDGLGMDLGVYPTTKKVVFGVSVSF